MKTKILSLEVRRGLLLLLPMCLGAVLSFAQNFILNSIDGVSRQFNQVNENQKISFISANAKEFFRLNQNSALVLIKTEKDDLGFTHYQYYQTYLNIRVEKTMFKVHTKAGFLKSMSGTIVTGFDALMNERNKTTVTASRAGALAIAHVGAKKYAWQVAGMEQRLKEQFKNNKATFLPKAELVWYNPGETLNPRQLKLCYKVDVYAIEPLSRAYYFIDAQSGKILGKEDRIHSSDVTGTANTAWSGTRTIHSDKTGTNAYRLRDYSRGSGVITLHGEYNKLGNDYTSTSSNWNLTGFDQAALDAHYGVEQTYSFYMSNFARNSYDGNGTALYSLVNDPFYTDNAYWDGSAMYYCKRSTAEPGGVTGIDVAGHELTHGVTQETCNLIYGDEPGAINESLSDIMGKSVQFWAKPNDINWRLSNDMNWIIRDLSNPNAFTQPDTYKGTFWYAGFDDNGGVHTNSGVGNFMFYLLVNGGLGTNDIGDAYTVSGIGLGKADQVIYRSQTVYLTENSQYADWRNACIVAASDLYGGASNEVAQVKNAFYAVGIGSFATSCDKPFWLTATDMTRFTATLGWVPGSNATAYNLQWKPVTVNTWTTVSGITANSYNLTNLLPGTSYNFRVENICSGSTTSGYSDTFEFATVSLHAQLPPGKQWDKRFGGSDYDALYSLQQTSDGGYILGGESSSDISGDKTEDRRGSTDYWIVKTGVNGSKQWDKRFGGNDYDVLYSLRQTSDGGYILGGYSNSNISGDKTEDSRGSTDYWIVKTDVNGSKQWDKCFGGNSHDELYSVQQTSDGGYILGGTSWSDIGGDKTQASRGWEDFWIVKTDSNGVKQWDKRFGGSNDESLMSLQQTSDGGYILGGTSESGIGGDKTEESRGGEDFWIIKINRNGVRQWDKRYGGSNVDRLSFLQQTSDGGYILGGESYSDVSGDKTEASRGASDFWIVKTDPDGNKQWDKRFGGIDADYLVSLQQTTDGGYILGGPSYSNISGDKTEDSRGERDYWTVKTDKNGMKEWDKQFGGDDEEYLESLQQTSDGNYILGGYSYSGISGDKSQNKRGLYTDFWIVKTGPLCSIPQPVITASASTTNVCPGKCVTLTSSPAHSYLWNTGDTTQSVKICTGGSYMVTVADISGCQNTSEPIVVTYQGCGVPTGVAVSNIATTSAGIKWNAVNCAIGYQYQYRKKGTTAWTTVQLTGKNNTSKTLTGLTPSSTYQWRVLTVCKITPDTIASGNRTGPEFTTAAGLDATEISKAGVKSITTSNANLYPNPSKGEITVAYNSSSVGNIQLRICDVAGRQVFLQNNAAIKGTNTYHLKLSHLSAGIYYFELINNERKERIKFIVEK